jgi:hypothetical protein
MINKHWLNLTLFHYLPGASATNHPIESYYSKSLKTDNKKQFRTDILLSEVAERIDFS